MSLSEMLARAEAGMPSRFDDDPELSERINREVLNITEERLVTESLEAYRSTLNRLWVANGAGVGLLASSKGVDTKHYLAPLAIYLVGLLALAGGEVVELVRKWQKLRQVEQARSYLDLPGHLFPRPTVRTGFSFKNGQSVSALIAAAMFIVATGWALCLLVAG